MVTSPDIYPQLTQLMQAAMHGDARAYTVFLQEVTRHLRRFLARRLPDSEVEDVIQEILLSLHKARPTYDGQRPVWPWVVAIARFRLTDYLRSYYRRQAGMSVSLDGLENILCTVTEEAPGNEPLEEALAALPPRTQTIVQMLHGEGHSVREISATLAMSESAVKVTAHRAYKAMRKRLGGEG